jgi:ATP-dependent DNA ligase
MRWIFGDHHERAGHRAPGLVAKDEASAYEGGRTTRWLKVKQEDWTVEEDRWRRTISAASSRGRGPKTK